MSLRLEVFELDQGRCVGCGHKMARGGDAWAWQCHHALKVQWLRARGCQPKWWRGPALCVLLCRRCHMQHEARAAMVPLERLPERVHRSVAILGPWAVDLLRRYHPPDSLAIPNAEQEALMQIIDSQQYDPGKPIDPSSLHEVRKGDRVRVRYSPTPERTIDGYGAVREIARYGIAEVAMDDGTTERVGAGCLSWPGDDA